MGFLPEVGAQAGQQAAQARSMPDALQPDADAGILVQHWALQMALSGLSGSEVLRVCLWRDLCCTRLADMHDMMHMPNKSL